MWILALNDMRSAHYENLQPVCRADTLLELLVFPFGTIYSTYGPAHSPSRRRRAPVARCMARSSRAARGPLEWFNPPLFGLEHKHLVEVGADTIVDPFHHTFARDVPHVLVGMIADRGVTEVLSAFGVK